ncbi:hypothetical protein V6N11_077042 [Hibiscus sabdariffa]|uniref:Reverse transcriptase zinc-binding domain-containing protein n=1 Tax=Hibiscus sabdariffa TaxID=183260 RepID=A0ABR2TBW9_9ROSI
MGGKSTVYDAFSLQSIVSKNAGKRSRLLENYLGVIGSSICQLCHQEDEDVLHAIRGCPRARHVWSKMLYPTEFSEFMSLPLKDWMLANINAHGSCSHDVAEWLVRFAVFC